MLVEELVKDNPSALIELFELNVRDLPGYGPLDIELTLPEPDQGIYRFYSWGINELYDALVWKGKSYVPYPIEVQGFSLEGNKQIPRPIMTVSNLGSIIQDLVYKYEDILGAKLTRKRTFAKFLDAANFNAGNPDEDPTQEFPDTVYHIRKKNSENIETMVFELSSPFDVEGVKLPRRIMNTNICPSEYRGTECGYSGNKYFDVNDNSHSDAANDVCGKKLSSCLLRFPSRGEEVRFAGFPGIVSKG